ncbi:hypothetical protein COCCU_06825 [Corynebacterium occultum]|uniref:Uncharacterized protein n=1 Tax=Corynebacterium occultum TaxID=2675219 RepID=A0A6B8WBB4_9CORY|nr:hypothetical protein [Corynebacterium occultum]QGU07300.1 hypothetical protein COCCU_06825 [Corynebacterium occultum]
MPGSLTTFLYNLATWAVLGVFGGIVTGQILDPTYLALLSSAWADMSSSPY